MVQYDRGNGQNIHNCIRVILLLLKRRLKFDYMRLAEFAQFLILPGREQVIVQSLLIEREGRRLYFRIAVAKKLLRKFTKSVIATDYAFTFFYSCASVLASRRLLNVRLRCLPSSRHITR